MESTQQEAAPAATKKVAGLYVLIYRTGSVLGYQTYDSKKGLKGGVEVVVSSGGAIEGIFKGAKKVDFKLKQVAHF